MSAKNKLDLEKEVTALEVRLADLKARLPAHSIPPAMMTELDEIEDQLAQAKSSLAEANAYYDQIKSDHIHEKKPPVGPTGGFNLLIVI